MRHELQTEILAALASLDARDCRRSPNAQVWVLEEPGLLASGGATRNQALLQCKRRLLRAFAAVDGSAFLHHPDDPEDSAVQGHWARVGTHAYRMPAELHLDDSGLDYWLFSLGNWLAYVAPAPVSRGGPDPFKTEPRQLLAWMVSARVQALIASFPDDTEWVVALTAPLAA